MEQNRMATTSEIDAYLDNQGDWVRASEVVLERTLFHGVCSTLRLNPLLRQIHAGKQYSREKGRFALIPIVGYETYIGRAEQLLDWWTADFTGQGESLEAVVEIKRKDRDKPFRWTVALSEYDRNALDDKGNRIWREKPRTMLRKVCISQAFRVLFPVECGDLPYTQEEILVAEQAQPDEIPEMDLFGAGTDTQD